MTKDQLVDAAVTEVTEHIGEESEVYWRSYLGSLFDVVFEMGKNEGLKHAVTRFEKASEHWRVK